LGGKKGEGEKKAEPTIKKGKNFLLKKKGEKGGGELTTGQWAVPSRVL